MKKIGIGAVVLGLSALLASPVFAMSGGGGGHGGGSGHGVGAQGDMAAHDHATMTPGQMSQGSMGQDNPQGAMPQKGSGPAKGANKGTMPQGTMNDSVQGGAQRSGTHRHTGTTN